ncbi:MAG TPA: 50S ribosomal protein L9 [Thermomicrobiales bacterium]|nr:50S ribosomal protein L9 [Thermomicrobiales bacterium]
MKVILTQDVEQLGTAGTLHEVKPGYARNYLIPKGLAQAATPGAIKQVEIRQAAEQRRIAKLEAEQQSLADRLDGMRLEFVARAGAQGRLFGSVTGADIAERLTQEVGQEIDRRKVDLPHGIHETGEFAVPVRLVGRLAPVVTVLVRAEGGGDVTEPAATEANEEAPGAEIEEEEHGMAAEEPIVPGLG